MNAAIFTKSAKGLILASSLIAVSGVVGHAQEATVALGVAAQAPLSNAYQTPPAGMASLGGHTFDLTTGTAVAVQDGTSASFTGSFKNPQAVYALVNTYDSYWWYKGQTAGRLTLKFSDGTTQSTDLTVGGNVREWRTGDARTVDATTDPATLNVWNGAAQPTAGGGNAVIDMLTINVTSTGKTLTGVTLSSAGVATINGAPLGILFSAVTVDYTPFTRPGNSGNTPAMQNSQAQQHSNSANFTGQSPAQGKSAASATAGLATPATTVASPAAAETDKHTNRGHR